MLSRLTTTAKSAKAWLPLALLGVLAMGSWMAWTAFAASGPATPTITQSPANPTNATIASFKYSSAGATSYQCKLDAALVFTACPASGITYPVLPLLALPPGSHTFQVRAVDTKGNTSGAASYTWVIDTGAPTLSSIVRTDPNPTKANPLRWTVTFSEPVKNLATSNFALVTGGLGGSAPSISTVTPLGSAPASAWTVTASTAGTTAGNAGSIGLNLTSMGTIKDAAGNDLAGSVPRIGEAYIFDTTAPTTAGVTIVRSAATPTKDPSVTWTVTFGEPVNGGTASNFALVATGLSGSPAVTAVSGSGTTRIVTASTGSGSGTLQLRLSTTSAISDLAGNALTGTVPVNGATYDIDRTAPPVVFTSKPPDPSGVSSSTFAWTSSPATDVDHYECSTENGAFSTQVQSEGGSPRPCTSPLTYVVKTTNNGQHQFAVRAFDHLGNVTEISYSWKVAAGSIQNFTISGNAIGLLFPGAAARTVAVTLTNPNSVPIFVTDLQVAITGNSKSASGCATADNYVVTQSGVSATTPVQIPAGASVTLPAQGASAPNIAMPNLASNQDACKNAALTLGYTGSAHS